MMRLVQVLTMLLAAPLLQGVMSSLRARLNGRPGPSLLQPYRNLKKLWKKEALVAIGTSVVVTGAPGLVAGVAVTLCVLVPTIGDESFAPQRAIAIALVVALGRFAIVLAAIDTRSFFGGMAASREAAFASLTEAPLIIAIMSLALPGHAAIARVLAATALLLVCLFETARIPVDNQETHYELTMIHEGLVLEYSGWHLSLLQYASQVRQISLLLLAALLLPVNPIVGFGAIVISITVIERALAKLRLFEVPALFAAASILAATGLIVAVAGFA